MADDTVEGTNPAADGPVPPSETSAGAARPPGRGRLVASIVLLVVALVATPLFVIAAWANQTITNTDRYVDAVSPLADNPQVQQYIAGELTTAFTSNVDLDSLLASELPPALQQFSTTIASSIDGFIAAAANRFTASPAFKTLWVEANRTAHRVLSRVLTGDLERVDLEGGQLTINLGDALRRLQERLVGEGFELAGRIDLSGVDRQLVLADGERIAKIEKARDLIGLLNNLVWVLGIVAIVGAVGSVLVAPRRGAATKRLGIGVALVVVVVAVVVAATRQSFLSATSEAVPAPVMASFFDALVGSMRFALRVVFALGLVVAILAVLVSAPSYPTRWARPAQVGVAVLGVAALIAPSELRTGYIVTIAIAVVIAIAVLELARRRGMGEPVPAVAPTV